MKKIIASLVFASGIVGCSGAPNSPLFQDAGSGSKCDQAYQYMKDCGVDQGLEYCSDCWAYCLNSTIDTLGTSCVDIKNRQTVWWSYLNACLDTCN